MADDFIRVGDHFVIPGNELVWKFGPSGGPGGQHANRAHTRAELRWVVSTASGPNDWQRETLIDKLGDPVLVVVDEQRSQLRNRDTARDRLAARIAAALHRDRPRMPTRPSRRSQRKRVDGKRQRGEVKRQRGRPNSDD
jgi:ribosome-associated protein